MPAPHRHVVHTTRQTELNKHDFKKWDTSHDGDCIFQHFRLRCLVVWQKLPASIFRTDDCSEILVNFYQTAQCNILDKALLKTAVCCRATMLALMLLHCLRVLRLIREAVLVLGLLKVTRMLLCAFLTTGVQEAEKGIRYSSHTEILCKCLFRNQRRK